MIQIVEWHNWGGQFPPLQQVRGCKTASPVIFYSTKVCMRDWWCFVMRRQSPITEHNINNSVAVSVIVCWMTQYHNKLLRFWLLAWLCSSNAYRGSTRMKPEVTVIWITVRWPLENNLNFDGHRLCVPKFRYSTLQQTTCHWWLPMSCFGITNHSEAASLWLLRQD